MSSWPGFVGPTYTGTSRNVDAELCMNLVPEYAAEGGAHPKRPLVYYPRMGLRTWVMAGSGPIRGLFSQDDVNLAVSGGEVYTLDAAMNATLVGVVANNPSPATLVSNGSQGGQVLIVSAGDGYIYDVAAGTLTPIVAAGFPPNAPMGAFLDSYFLAMESASVQFGFSDLFDGTAWDPTDVAQKTFTTDNIRALYVDHKELWLFGSLTTEVWVASGDPLNPLVPVPGVLIEHGIGPVWSVAKAGNTLCWIGQDQDGGGQAWRADGYVPVRFSTHGVEQRWATYSTLQDAIAWSYQTTGHQFYVVTFPTAGHTWVYDFATSQWHEEGVWVGTDYEAHLGRCHAYAFGGVHLVGSRVDGTIYEMSPDVYDDAGTVLRRERRVPVLANQADEWDIFHSLQLLMEPGAGLKSGQGSDPQVMLRMSRDSGYRYDNERWASLGVRGARDTRAIWRRAGRARNAIVSVVQTDPTPTCWLDMLVNAEPGIS